MKLSIVVPCFNEEQNIEDFYDEIVSVLLHLDVDFQLIFSDDGSSDLTLRKIKSLSEQDQRVQYISFSRNFGKESAMLAGLTYSDGDAVIIMDADLQHPPQLIKELLRGYNEGYGQVIAKRNRTGESVPRSLLSSLYYKMMNNAVDVTFHDGVGDFRLLSRPAVNALLSLSEYNRFSKGLFSWIGFDEKIVEYENVLRTNGESKWSFSKLLNYGIDGIISFNNKPLRLSIYLGLSITLIGLVYIIYSLVSILINGIEEPGYFTIISAILLFGGIQLIFMGVMGEYIGRIYYETKRRPHFIVQDTNIHHLSPEKEKVKQ
ncbi:glycosyltransferase [Jeotgalibacillus sp. R-1-5s-1]|nr:glycosyltransferase [Jeotgalibacillus sp. R-1-5s-1]